MVAADPELTIPNISIHTVVGPAAFGSRCGRLHLRSQIRDLAQPGIFQNLTKRPEEAPWARVESPGSTDCLKNTCGAI